MSQVSTTPVQDQITQKLQRELTPTYLEVMNESYMHSVPKGSESHFKVIVVSDHFSGMRLISRHRTINQILSEELAGVIHALAIHTYTDEEWAEQAQAPDSPACMGGSKLG